METKTFCSIGEFLTIILLDLIVFFGFVCPALKGEKINLPSDSIIGLVFFYVLGGLWAFSILGYLVFPGSNFFSRNSSLNDMDLIGAHFVLFAILFTYGLAKQRITFHQVTLVTSQSVGNVQKDLPNKR